MLSRLICLIRGHIAFGWSMHTQWVCSRCGIKAHTPPGEIGRRGTTRIQKWLTWDEFIIEIGRNGEVKRI